MSNMTQENSGPRPETTAPAFQIVPESGPLVRDVGPNPFLDAVNTMDGFGFDVDGKTADRKALRRQLTAAGERANNGPKTVRAKFSEPDANGSVHVSVRVSAKRTRKPMSDEAKKAAADKRKTTLAARKRAEARKSAK